MLLTYLTLTLALAQAQALRCPPYCRSCTPTQCLACSPPFFLTDASTCIFATPIPNCLAYSADSSHSKCVKCDGGKIVESGRCIDPIKGCLKYAGEKCAQCSPPYKQFSGKCQYVDTFCLQLDQEGNCIQCGSGLLPDGERCVFFEPGCLFYGPDRTCSRSIPLYTLKENIPQASKDEYRLFVLASASATGKTQSPKSPNLQKSSILSAYHSSRGIIEIYPPLKVQNSKASSKTRDGLISSCRPPASLIAHVCIDPQDPLIEGCEQFDPAAEWCVQCSKGNDMMATGRCEPRSKRSCSTSVNGSCQKCSPQFSLWSQMCVNSMQGPKGDSRFFEVEGKSMMWPLLPNCKEQRQLGSCSICQPEFSLKGKACIKATDHCEEYNKYGICSKCENGYAFEGANCVALNCNAVIGSICNECAAGYYYRSGKCYRTLPAKCMIGHPDGKCMLCTTGFELNQRTNRCQDRNSHCSSMVAGDCSGCESGYTFVAEDKRCLRMTKNCLSYSTIGECASCAINYGLENGNCLYMIENCVDLDQDKRICNKCKGGFKLQFNKCVALVAGCTQYEGQACLKCGPGSYLMGQICQPNPPNCSLYSDELKQCVECNEAYDVEGGKCVLKKMIRNGCRSFRPNGLDCMVCDSGFKLYSGACYAENCAAYTLERDCQNCTQYFELSANKKYCLPYFCLIFDSASSNCTLPKPHYEGGHLISLSNTITIAHCTQASPSGICVKCANRTPNTSTQYGLCYPLNCQDTHYNCLKCQNGFVPHPSDPGTCTAAKCALTNEMGKCINCMSPYSLTKDGTCQTYGPCELFDETGKSCIQCKSRFELHSGFCSPNNCQEFKPIPTDSSCLKCKPGFEKTPEGGCRLAKCTQETTETFCKVCLPRYQVNPMLGICEPAHCQSYDSITFKCIRCQSDFTLTADGVCKAKNCLREDGNACVECIEGYSLQNSLGCWPNHCTQMGVGDKCQVCEDGFIPSATTGLCDSQNLFCAQFSRTGDCIKCKPELILVLGQCIYEVPGCSEYSRHACNRCKNGMTLAEGKCQASKCARFPNNSGLCSQCVDGYERQANGLCKVRNCEFFDQESWLCNSCYGRFYLSMDLCIPSNCSLMSPTSLTTCLMCDPLFEEENGGCVHKNCRNAKDTFCRSCKEGWLPDYSGICSVRDCKTSQFMTGLCLTCHQGKRNVNGTCLHDKCSWRNEEGECLMCEMGYYLTSDKGFCIAYYCQDWNLQNGHCNQCAVNFQFRDGACISTLCTSFESQNSFFLPSCTRCPDGYSPYLQYCAPAKCKLQSFDPLANQCQQCEKGYESKDSGCQLANCHQFATNTSLECSKCSLGFEIANGLCLTRNCDKFQELTTSCIKCSKGFSLFSNMCLALNCLSFDLNAACQSCSSNFKLLPNGSCKRDFCITDSEDKCLQCEDGYHVGPYNGGFCVPVNCQSWSMGKCRNCQKGFELDNGICKDINCAQLSATYECIVCRRGFVIGANGFCVIQARQFCPPSTYYDAERQYCAKIPISNCQYVEESEPNLCIQCNKDYFIWKGQCRSFEGCREYSYVEGCLSCLKGYTLLQRLCTNTSSDGCLISVGSTCSVCRQGYVLTEQLECVGERQNCKAYSLGKCSACSDGFELDRNGYCAASSCAMIDQITFGCLRCNNGYMVTSKATCQPIPLHCKEYSEKECLECEQGYLLKQNSCTISPVSAPSTDSWSVASAGSSPVVSTGSSSGGSAGSWSIQRNSRLNDLFKPSLWRSE